MRVVPVKSTKFLVLGTVFLVFCSCISTGDSRASVSQDGTPRGALDSSVKPGVSTTEPRKNQPVSGPKGSAFPKPDAWGLAWAASISETVRADGTRLIFKASTGSSVSVAALLLSFDPQSESFAKDVARFCFLKNKFALDSATAYAAEARAVDFVRVSDASFAMIVSGPVPADTLLSSIAAAFPSKAFKATPKLISETSFDLSRVGLGAGLYNSIDQLLDVPKRAEPFLMSPAGAAFVVVASGERPQALGSDPLPFIDWYGLKPSEGAGRFIAEKPAKTPYSWLWKRVSHGSDPGEMRVLSAAMAKANTPLRVNMGSNTWLLMEFPSATALERFSTALESWSVGGVGASVRSDLSYSPLSHMLSGGAQTQMRSLLAAVAASEKPENAWVLYSLPKDGVVTAHEVKALLERHIPF